MAGPSPLLAGALAGTLESAIGAYLALAPNRQDLLAPLAGKVIALNLQPFGTLYLCPTATNLQVLGEFSGTPDVRLTGTLAAFTRLHFGGSVRGSLAAGDIEMQGDMNTARHFQALFDQLDINWEALLAPCTGPVVAATALDWLRSGALWTRDAVETLRTDLAEFWQEETRELPTQSEAKAFCADVDALRNDRDRLEARIRRLEQAAAAELSAPNT